MSSEAVRRFKAAPTSPNRLHRATVVDRSFGGGDDEVPRSSARYLSSARQAGRYAAHAGSARLVLTHLWPGSNRDDSLGAARAEFSGGIDVAIPGLVVDLR